MTWGGPDPDGLVPGSTPVVGDCGQGGCRSVGLTVEFDDPTASSSYRPRFDSRFVEVLFDRLASSSAPVLPSSSSLSGAESSNE